MAKIEFSGFDEVELALKGVIDGVDELSEELMKDCAEINKQEIERAIFQSGEFKTGALLRSIKIGKRKDEEGKHYYIVHPAGKNDNGVANSYVGFVRNYGRSNSPGSRFWDTARQRTIERFQSILEMKVKHFFKQKGLD